MKHMQDKLTSDNEFETTDIWSLMIDEKRNIISSLEWKLQKAEITIESLERKVLFWQKKWEEEVDKKFKTILSNIPTI